jgi:hypothetical protein
MSRTQLLRTVLLAAPAALLALGCSSEVQPAKPAGDTHDHAADDGHDHADHADHGEQPGDHTDAVAAPGAGETAVADAHSADDGHDHSADDGHDHSADDGHDHARDGLQINNPPPLGSGDGPRLMYRVGEEAHSFGRLMQGTVAEHTFELENEGNEDLIIKQVKPTCGCTVAQVEVEDAEGNRGTYTFGDPIAPGSSVWVPAKLHTKNKSGHQTTRINVFSNDPRGTIQLGLEADIDPFFAIAPRFLNFGQVSVGDVVTKKAVISTTKGDAVALSMVEQSLPAGSKCTLTPIEPGADGKASRWDLEVTLGPDLTEGNLARAVNVVSDVAIPGAEKEIDGEATYAATITVSAQVVGPFSYNPPYVSMGLVRPGQVASRTVTIESHDEAFSFAEHVPQVQIVGLANPATGDGQVTYREWEYADAFTPTVRPVEGKNAVEVELRLEGLPDDALGSFRGTLVVTLDHPDKKDIALVITGVCRGGPAK